MGRVFLQMKIVVLDLCTLSRADLDFSELESLGEVEYYDVLPEDRLVEAIGDAEVLLVNKAKLRRDVIFGCKNLKMIGLFATGYDNVDLAAASERGICVCNVPGYSTDCVAQQAFAFILAHATSLCEYNASVNRGEWVESGAFSYFPFPISELAGKTLGIFGYGAIGKKVAAIGSAFGMRVIVHTRTQPADCPFALVGREELFRESDYLTFHCPLTEQTRGLVNKDTLAMMKPSAFLVNTSRGGVVVEEDLADALNRGVIAGAGVDVLRVEPMTADQPLRRAKNCMITPHIAWAGLETRTRLVSMVCENVRAFQRGAPIHKVN